CYRDWSSDVCSSDLGPSSSGTTNVGIEPGICCNPNLTGTLGPSSGIVEPSASTAQTVSRPHGAICLYENSITTEGRELNRRNNQTAGNQSQMNQRQGRFHHAVSS